MKTRDLTYMAFYLGLFAVLDFVANRVPIFQMPNGGSLGLGIVPLLLASYHLGWKKGVFVGVLSVAIQALVGQLYIVDFPQFMLEYFIAFGIYGIAVLFKNYKMVSIPLYTGIIVTNLIRFLCHWVAGVYYWGLDWSGSAIYNSGYMIATTILCLIIVPLVMIRLPKSKITA